MDVVPCRWVMGAIFQNKQLLFFLVGFPCSLQEILSSRFGMVGLQAQHAA